MKKWVLVVVGVFALAGGALAVTSISAVAHPGHHVKAGAALLVGTVKSVQDGKLEVARDGGGDVTVTTDQRTKARGADALSGLKPGQRVVVRVKDGKAFGVQLPSAAAKGTVTSVDGDKAVLIETNGLQVALDLSGVSEKPKSGDLVAVHGSASDGGKTLKVDKVRQLPKAG